MGDRVMMGHCGAVSSYDTIGWGYAGLRREDPRIAAVIEAALGNAKSVVNVGAGAGSYEPAERHVIAIEPSLVMAAQRPSHRVPAILGEARSLPLIDDSVDGAMAVLTVHHWEPDCATGIAELRRVARGPVVIVTIDPEVSAQMWLMRDYLPEVAALDRQTFPSMAQLTQWLGTGTTVKPIAVHRDSCDWSLVSYWAHPERVLDGRARSATSGFARMSDEVVQRVVADVAGDLQSGAWDRKYGHLRTLDEYDAGLRLVVAR